MSQKKNYIVLHKGKTPLPYQFRETNRLLDFNTRRKEGSRGRQNMFQLSDVVQISKKVCYLEPPYHPCTIVRTIGLAQQHPLTGSFLA
jgi:site-specific DNA-adenine methylase